MKAREKMSGRIILALLVAALAAALAGCPNLSRDLDLKAAIEEDVREANAEQITVRILPENDAMGLTNPYGTASVKLGVAFRVSTTVSSEYAFVRWEKTAGDGDVSFADATSPETMATVSGNGVGIEITARFDARPVVVIKEPEGTGVLVNAPIAITFSEDVDDSTIILDETVLVRVSPDKVSWSSPVGVTLAKSVSGSLVTISLTAGTYGVNYYVRVDVLKSVTDLDGHMMPQGMFWWFKTGSQEDTEDPNLVSFVLKDGAAVITDGGATNRTTGLTIATTATDNLTVTTMRVKETDLTTLAPPRSPALLPEPHLQPADRGGRPEAHRGRCPRRGQQREQHPVTGRRARHGCPDDDLRVHQRRGGGDDGHIDHRCPRRGR